MQDVTTENLLTQRQAADRLHRSLRHIVRMCSDGRLTKQSIGINKRGGETWRVSESELLRYEATIPQRNTPARRS